jgi:IS605 OrfB family transposase
LHALSKAIVGECVERGVSTVVVGDLGGIRDDDDNGKPRNWGDHGNLDLHGWAFDRFRTLLDYKGEAEGIDVELVSERDTSKSCSACGHTDGNQRVERGRERRGEHSARGTSRVSPRMAVIGITAGWHSQRFTCSTVVKVFLPHENRL